MKICLLDRTSFEYSYEDKYSNNLRGAETVLINLYQELSNLGHDVFVFNNCATKISVNNTTWFNLSELNKFKDIYFDLCITNADINLLNKINSKKNMLFRIVCNLLKSLLEKINFLVI